ncbi:hypothetical protein Ahy_A01g003252 [Arachis hypogaea]|uniref:Uncharacterized protein n=1 Tax=Arachis hypogaea TaxID=3818 RepID=A0A445ESR9_ARAHY|nr:hypothetical protein Ahy_A01g003252 [Arachis hypogaea]
MGMISQDHAKLDSDIIADAIRKLVEVDPLIKVKSIIAEVQSRFNYIVSYCKAWFAKQNFVANFFGVGSAISSRVKVGGATKLLWGLGMEARPSCSGVRVTLEAR